MEGPLRVDARRHRLAEGDLVTDHPRRALAVVNALAPIRICDCGGWTDTWFARHGQVLNVAVHPCAEVQVKVRRPGDGGPDERVVLHPEDLGAPYSVTREGPPWGPHPLLEAAIALMRVPRELRLEITVHSEAPAGAGTGTSAAVTVALLGALDALTPGRFSPREVAAAAHRVETEMLGRQCGIQDQLASAHGGINFIDMPDYPRATVTPVPLPDPLWWELERRFVLVYLGRSHDSSALHETVIRSLEDEGPDSPPKSRCDAPPRTRGTPSPPAASRPSAGRCATPRRARSAFTRPWSGRGPAASSRSRGTTGRWAGR